MFFGKKAKKSEKTYVKLSDDAVNFIKNVVVNELKITKPITGSKILDVEEWIHSLIDEKLEYDENDNKYVPMEQLNDIERGAYDLLTELNDIVQTQGGVEDLDDLNARLGLI